MSKETYTIQRTFEKVPWLQCLEYLRTDELSFPIVPGQYRSIFYFFIFLIYLRTDELSFPIVPGNIDLNFYLFYFLCILGQTRVRF